MSDIFDPAYDDNPTIHARADQDDAYLYDTNQPPQWALPDPDTNTRAERLTDVRNDYHHSLYPTHFIEDTETTFYNHYTNPPNDPRNQIFIADPEGVVGVSAREFIIAVTNQHGAFAQPSTFEDVTATIQQLGLEPNALAHALQRADHRGFDLNPALSQHPAIDAARAAITPQENTITEPTTTTTPIDLTADTQPTTTQRDVIYGYDSRLETFQATIWGDDGEPQQFGTTQGQHLTIESLHSAVSPQDTSPYAPQELQELASQVRADTGDFTIVGLKDEGNPRLFIVTPNQAVTELTSDGEYSPEGFNWGYDGSGPAQTTKAIIEIAQGATRAESVEHVRSITGSLSANLPDNFAIAGTDLTNAVDGRPETALNISSRPATSAISAVREHINTPAPHLELQGPSRDIGASL